MRSGVSFPSFTADATWGVDFGTADPDYPASNAGDLYNIRTPFISAAGGGSRLTFVFSQPRPVQFMALLHHNATAAETTRLRLYSDNLTTQVYDSGVITMFPTGSSPTTVYPQNFPLLLPAPVTALSGRIGLSSSLAVPWIIGGVELSGFWPWTDIEVPREIGFQNSDVLAQQPFGVDHAMSQFAPRTFVGTRGNSDQAENATTMVDFQLEKKTSKPFVFCWDIDDPVTYKRLCILMRNSKLTPPNQGQYPVGAQRFDFIEHLR